MTNIIEKAASEIYEEAIKTYSVETVDNDIKADESDNFFYNKISLP